MFYRISRCARTAVVKLITLLGNWLDSPNLSGDLFSTTMYVIMRRTHEKDLPARHRSSSSKSVG